MAGKSLEPIVIDKSSKPIKPTIVGENLKPRLFEISAGHYEKRVYDKILTPQEKLEVLFNGYKLHNREMAASLILSVFSLVYLAYQGLNYVFN